MLLCSLVCRLRFIRLIAALRRQTLALIRRACLMFLTSVTLGGLKWTRTTDLALIRRAL